MTSINQSVVITGASGGVGSALVSRLAQQGWTVFAGVRSSEAASRLAQHGENVIPVGLDVTDAATLDAARAEVERHLQQRGRPGLFSLVNNAGKSADGPLELLPLGDLEDIFAVNVIGQLAVTQTFLPLLRAAHGRIVNMGGAAGRVAMPMYGALSATKAALDSFTDALRMELVLQGVDVTYIEPGALDTDFFAQSAALRGERGYAGDPATQAAYREALSRTAAAMAKTKPEAVGPVVRAIERALTARRPASRYVVGRQARAVTGIVRRLPTRTRDRAIMRTMDLRADAFTG